MHRPGACIMFFKYASTVWDPYSQTLIQKVENGTKEGTEFSIQRMSRIFTPTFGFACVHFPAGDSNSPVL